MPEQKVTDAQFIEVWKKYGSPTKVARALGITERRAYQKRLDLVGKGLVLDTERDGRRAYIPAEQYSGRLGLDIEKGHVLVASDAHYYPGVVTTAHKAFVKLCGEIRPRAVIMNGDIFDGAAVSRWPRIGWDNQPKVIDELKAVEERLTEIEAVARTHELYWPLGNHDARFETFLASRAPEFEGVDGFSLKQHFPLWRACWSIWMNNDVVIKHRLRGGIHATHNNVLWAGKTTVTGHLHSLKVTPFSDYGGTRWGVDTGTLAEPHGPQFQNYTEDNPVNWRSGFVLLTFHKGKLLWPQVINVRPDLGSNVVEFGATVFEV